MGDRTTRPHATLSGVSHPAATSSSPFAVLAWLAGAPGCRECDNRRADDDTTK